ncbi:MAG: GNAT family N-acetyltransferase [Chitinispirillaceae bacterium]|nr:GNAT family N-acetyltransferase [Chitinispirillaceae bacterium]
MDNAQERRCGTGDGFVTEPAGRNRWVAFCEESDRATFFHTPYWAELFTGRFPRNFRAKPAFIRFDDGNVALVPLVYKQHLGGLLRIACSMPAGTFGGYLTQSVLSPEQERAVLRYMLRSSDCIFRENPYQPVREFPDTVSWVEDPTQAVDLEDGYESAWKRATAAHRNAVRNAVKAGVTVGEAGNGEDWKTYVAIYGESIRRWRKKERYSGVAYDERFFLRIAALDAPLRKLWIARVNGRPVAGILCFYWNRHAVVWHGSALEEFFSYHPNNLLYDRAMAHAADAGYRWFDCNPSGTLHGVFKFKQYIGAKQLRSRVVVKRSRLLRMLQALRATTGKAS